MKEIYTQFIQHASQQLAALLLAQLPAERLAHVQYQDQEAAEVLRRVGQEAMRLLFATLSQRVTDEAQAEGFTVERRPSIRVEVLFGPVEVESPYLWRAHEGRRPADTLQVVPQSCVSHCPIARLSRRALLSIQALDAV